MIPALRIVDHCWRRSNPVFEPDQDAASFLDGELHRRHGPLPDHALEQAAAVTDDPDGIVEAQRTGDMGSRGLSETMAHHGLGLDAPGAPQSRQGDLNRKESRLDDVDLVQSRPGGIASPKARRATTNLHRVASLRRSIRELPERRLPAPTAAGPCQTIDCPGPETRRRAFAAARQAFDPTTGRDEPRPVRRLPGSPPAAVSNCPLRRGDDRGERAEAPAV